MSHEQIGNFEAALPRAAPGVLMRTWPQPKRGCWLSCMLTTPEALVADFAAAAIAAGVEGWPCEIRTETLPAPQHHLPLPAGFGAVCVFALGSEYGRDTPAGAGAVLKVGRVGPASGLRFSYQHYGTSARSTLAKSLALYRIMWPWLGIDSIDNSSVTPMSFWMSGREPGGSADVLLRLAQRRPWPSSPPPACGRRLRVSTRPPLRRSGSPVEPEALPIRLRSTDAVWVAFVVHYLDLRRCVAEFARGQARRASPRLHHLSLS